MIYKNYEIAYDKKKPAYEVRSNAHVLKTIAFKKNSIQGINKALTKAKKFIDSIC